MRYKHETHRGEHRAIIELKLWREVQKLLRQNARTERSRLRHQSSALLKGILRCGACGCAMTPAYSVRSRNRRYRYYVCTTAQKRGWETCPVKSVPAYEVEQFVIERLRAAGRASESGMPEELTDFGSVWPTLDRQGQTELLDRLVERIEYDGKELLITFRAAESAAETSSAGERP